MHTVEVRETVPADWDETIRDGACDSLKLFHSTPYAALQSEFRACTPLFITVSRLDRPVLRLVLFKGRSELPVGSALSPRIKTAVRRALKMKTCAVFWWGQAVRVGPADQSAYRELAAAIDRIARKASAVLAFGQWPETARETLPVSWKGTEWGTLKIDLNPTVDEIRAGFKPAARKAIKRGETEGITVTRLVETGELRAYYDFAKDCAQRYGTGDLLYAAFENPWRHLRPGAIFETFVAKHQDKPIAGLSVWGLDDQVMELGSYQSEDCFRLKLPGPDAIKWELIKWAREAGVRQYDLAGVNPNPLTKKEAGIRQFKEKWGGSPAGYLMVQS